MKLISSPRHRLTLLFALVSCGALGCNDDATSAVIVNGYDAMTVVKGWWATTLFSTPVAPGGSSETERTIPASDFAYVLVAPGSDQASRAPLVALKSAQPLAVSKHDLLTIAVSDDGFVGNCAAGSALAETDARLIVERIFPGDFAGLSYDAATCVSTPAPGDGAP